MEIPDSNMVSLNKSRQRDIYISPDGRLTTPLPSDPSGKVYYQSKGFQIASEAAKSEIPPIDVIKCPICKLSLPDPLALRDHLNTHFGFRLANEATKTDKPNKITNIKKRRIRRRYAKELK